MPSPGALIVSLPAYRVSQTRLPCLPGARPATRCCCGARTTRNDGWPRAGRVIKCAALGWPAQPGPAAGKSARTSHASQEPGLGLPIAGARKKEKLEQGESAARRHCNEINAAARAGAGERALVRAAAAAYWINLLVRRLLQQRPFLPTQATSAPFHLEANSGERPRHSRGCAHFLRSPPRCPLLHHVSLSN